MEDIYIGVDIGGTNIRVACSDIEGTVIHTERAQTCGEINSPSLVEKIIETIEASYGKITRENSDYQIKSIGIGIPGAYCDGKMMLCPNIQDINIQNLTEHFDKKGIPVALLNDVKCAALGEKWKGCARDNDNFLFLNIGTGLSVAMVLNGEIYLGNNSCSGEIGYWISDAGSPVGYAAGRAPLEEKFSGRWLTEKVRYALRLAECGDRPPRQKEMNTKDIFREYAKKNPTVSPIIDEGLKYFCTMLANLCILINPGMIVFGGGVSNDIACFIDPIRNYLAKTVPFPPALRKSALNGQAGIYGAVKLAIDKYSETREDRIHSDRPPSGQTVKSLKNI